MSKFLIGTGKEYTKVKFKKGKITCPVCSRTDDWHCSVTLDEGLCLCSNVPSEECAGDGRYIHVLKYSSVHENQQAVAELEDTGNNNPKADADRLDKVYTAYLKSLALNEPHRDNLRHQRGLSDTAIARNLYASVPAYAQRFKIGEKLAESFDLEGIPGFYKENDRWAMNVLYNGIYVPFRNELGQIIGLQIRQDADVDSKYLWVSSSSKEKGCSPGSPLHFVNTELVRDSNTVFLTEGALKADVIGELHKVGVVAMAGVNVLSPAMLADKLPATFPNLEKVVLAFDMDWETNGHVRTALLNLANRLSETRLEVEAIIWNKQNGKGLDDVLWNAVQAREEAANLTRYVSAREYLDMLLACGETKETTTETVIETDKSEEKNMNVIEETNQDKTFGVRCRDFLEMEFPAPEKVMFGLGRGNLGLMIASTNIGKTTLALNLTLSATGNRTFLPLFDENCKASRVMYIDGESTQADLQADLRTMLESCTPEEQELIKDNLCFICDAEIDDEPLDLVNPHHLQIVREKAEQFKPDLIIIDTLSALTIMEDENDNAKVKREVIQPLKTLGKKAGAGVLLLHHTGKFVEGSFQAEDAYKGRGASAFGALSRTIFNLKQPKGLKGNVELICSKTKGEEFAPVWMELNTDTRWFSVTGNVSEKKTKTDVKYDQVVNYVRDTIIKTGKSVQRKEIVRGMKGKVGSSTIDRKLELAVKRGDLLNDPENYGHYTAAAAVNPEQEMPLAE